MRGATTIFQPKVKPMQISLQHAQHFMDGGHCTTARGGLITQGRNKHLIDRAVELKNGTPVGTVLRKDVTDDDIMGKKPACGSLTGCSLTDS